MRTEFQSDLDSLEASFQEMGEVVSPGDPRRGRRASNPGRRALRRGRRVRRRDRRSLPGDREPDPARARPADAGRHRSPPRSRPSALRHPLRAHGRSVRHDREAHEALEPSRETKRDVIDGLVDMGERCVEMVRVVTRCVRDARRRAARADPRARRSRRPVESTGVRRGPRLRQRPRRRSSGACGRSRSLAASSASETTRSTSASRPLSS